MVLSQVVLRAWQKEALDALKATNSPDFLAVATPGAGKTTFALTAARIMLPNLPGRLVVVVPTSHLKQQWAEAALRFGLMLEQDWSPGETLPSDVHGLVTTYAQVGLNPAPLFDVSQGGFAILDEIHHAGSEKTWGEGVRHAFDGASKRLALSGTPFRSDADPIPFVTYVANEAEADYSYGYGEALKDGSVVRPVYFPRFGGHMEWTSSDGNDLTASFDDYLTLTESNQRLRAALSLNGEWLPAVLSNAVERLNHIRKSHTNAGGLVIAIDKEHARGIAKIMRSKFGIDADVVISEEADSSKKITRFSESNKPWLIAVRMVSEGVDIPRLRVGVYATTTTTELFFRQAVGRLVRHIKGGGLQRAYMFIPDDYRLRRYGIEISETRNHSLDKKASTDDERGERNQPEEQVSLFEVHSATLGEAAEPEIDPFAFDNESSEAPMEEPEEISSELVVDLAAMPLPGGLAQAPTAIDGRSERQRLRSINQSLARDIATITGQPHSAINRQLNKAAGVTKISEASVIQLNKRAREAEKLLDLVSRARPRQ